MSLRAFVPIVTVAAGLVAWSVHSSAQPPAPELLAHPAQPAFKIQGVGGCAAAGCHNAPLAAGKAGTEYATWVADPHGRAFATLESPLYKGILTRLKDTCSLTSGCRFAPLAYNGERFGNGFSERSTESCNASAGTGRAARTDLSWGIIQDAAGPGFVFILDGGTSFLGPQGVSYRRHVQLSDRTNPIYPSHSV